MTRVRDIGRVEIGAADYGSTRPTWIAARRLPLLIFAAARRQLARCRA